MARKMRSRQTAQTLVLLTVGGGPAAAAAARACSLSVSRAFALRPFYAREYRFNGSKRRETCVFIRTDARVEIGFASAGGPWELFVGVRFYLESLIIFFSS